LPTYKGYLDPKRVRYPISSKEFNPAAQDHLAIRIIAAQNGSLGLIRQGKIREAIYDAKLNLQWTSLPGGKECHLKGGYDEFIQMYQHHLQ